MPRNPTTPHRQLELPIVGELELVATLRAFQLFKAKTAELGLGPQRVHAVQKGVPILGRAQGISILRGGLEELDEETLVPLVWALAHGETVAGQEDKAPTLPALQEALQEPGEIVRVLEEVLELVREATGGDEEEDLVVTGLENAIQLVQEEADLDAVLAVLELVEEQLRGRRDTPEQEGDDSDRNQDEDPTTRRATTTT